MSGAEELRERAVELLYPHGEPLRLSHDDRDRITRLARALESYGRECAAAELDGWARSFRAVATAAIRRESRRIYPQVAAVLEAGARDLRAAALKGSEAGT